jgi:hypothetical protein
MNNDKQTNDALLCMVSPQYAMTMAGSVPLTDFDLSNPTSRVTLHVVQWYSDKYRHRGDWFTDSIRKPTNDEILRDIHPSIKQHAEELIAFKDSTAGKQRLLSAIGLA